VLSLGPHPRQGKMLRHLSRLFLLGSLDGVMHHLCQQLHIVHRTRGQSMRVVRERSDHEGRDMHAHIVHVR
jgi:hypothetical protein